ncbi:ABC transporter permease [Aquabacter spiritensis]|uniref:Taurine transport system permease protein n=1 Tax=Aquabacter spiritensis TaxID=933073 RepID=A0A4R3LWK4_9HYPH|nr:ABC transporter permease [Aquabacter spiritensis]TCT05011.1 taurine transport system permease protein [Aquabacter spiritensis]
MSAADVVEPSAPLSRRARKWRLGRERALTGLTVAGLFLAWLLSTHYGLVNPLFLPSPAAVWTAFVRTATEGYQGSLLHEHLLASLGRVLTGYVLACAIGIPLGIVMGLSRDVKAVFDPVIEFYRPLPPLALYTLIVMWLGIGDTSKVALLFLAALPPLTISSMQAAAGVDPRFVKAARSLGAGKAQLFRHVFLPACLPGICTGMRISLGFTYTVLVAAEIVAATAGLGWMIWDASKFLISDVVIMGLFVLALTGVALDFAIRRCERALTPWRFR